MSETLHDSPQFGLYPHGQAARVKIHQTIETVSHGTKHMYIDHFGTTELPPEQSQRNKMIFDYGIDKDYPSASGKKPPRWISRDKDWSSETQSVWNMSLRRINSLINPSESTWVYGIENQGVIQRLGYAYDGTKSRVDEFYIVVDKQIGPNEFQGYIQYRQSGKIYYLMLVDGHKIPPDQKKLDVDDYAEISWLALEQKRGSKNSSHDDRFDTTNHPPPTQVERYPQAMWTFTLDPDDPRGKGGMPKLLDCEACECPKSSGRESKDPRNEKKWKLLDQWGNPKGGYLLYDDGSLTGPQWNQLNELGLTQSNMACKAAADALGGEFTYTYKEQPVGEFMGPFLGKSKKSDFGGDLNLAIQNGLSTYGATLGHIQYRSEEVYYFKTASRFVMSASVHRAKNYPTWRVEATLVKGVSGGRCQVNGDNLFSSDANQSRLRNGYIVSLVQSGGMALYSNMSENGKVSLGKPRADRGWIIETEDGLDVKDGSRVYFRSVDNKRYMHDNAKEGGGFSGGGRNARVNWTLEEQAGNPGTYFIRGNSTGRYLYNNMTNGGGFAFGKKLPKGIKCMYGMECYKNPFNPKFAAWKIVTNEGVNGYGRDDTRKDYAEGKENVAYKFTLTPSHVTKEQATTACQVFGAGWSLATRKAIEENKEALSRSTLNGGIRLDSWQNSGTEQEPNVSWGYNYMQPGDTWKRANNQLSVYDNQIPAICMNPNVFSEYDGCSALKLSTSSPGDGEEGDNAKSAVMPCSGDGTGRASLLTGDTICPEMDNMAKMQHEKGGILDGAHVHQIMMPLDRTSRVVTSCLSPAGGKTFLRYKPYDEGQAHEDINVMDDTWTVGVYDEGDLVYRQKDGIPFKRLYLQRTSDKKYLTVGTSTGKVSFSSDRNKLGYAVEYRDQTNDKSRVWIIRLSSGYETESYLISKGAYMDSKSKSPPRLKRLSVTGSLETALLYPWRFSELTTDCPQLFNGGSTTFATCPSLFGSDTINKEQTYINADMDQPQGLSFIPQDMLKDWDQLWQKCGDDTKKAQIDPDCANFDTVKGVIDRWDPTGDTEFKQQYPTENNTGDRSTAQAYVRFCAQPVTVGCLPTKDKNGDNIEGVASCPYIKQAGVDGSTNQSDSTAFCKAANDDPELKRQTFIEYCHQCKQATPAFNSDPTSTLDERYKGCRSVCGCVLRHDNDKFVYVQQKVRLELEDTGQVPPAKCGWWTPCHYAGQSTGLDNPFLITEKDDTPCPSIQNCSQTVNLDIKGDVVTKGGSSFNIDMVCNQTKSGTEGEAAGGGAAAAGGGAAAAGGGATAAEGGFPLWAIAVVVLGVIIVALAGFGMSRVSRKGLVSRAASDIIVR